MPDASTAIFQVMDIGRRIRMTRPMADYTPDFRNRIDPSFFFFIHTSERGF
jgi:hypothetical protein